MKRLNRFAALVDLDSRKVKVYLPNSGRLEELLVPGAAVVVEKRRETGKTLHDLLLIETRAFPRGDGIWACLDSRLPPSLAEWAIQNEFLRVGDGETIDVRREPSVGEGRLDLLVRKRKTDVFIETKSVNLIDVKGVARFPDAPTIRGARHIETLIDLKKEGHDAVILFVVLREDARAFSPFQERDPIFAKNLLRAKKEGVEIRALKFAAGPSVAFLGDIDVLVPALPFAGYWPPICPAPSDEASQRHARRAG